jgi:hypothetical protein
MLGQTIAVKYDNKYCAENECFGRFISYDNIIIIASNCILYHSGNPDWMNEQLVESIAGLLHQYLTTNK